MKILFVLEHSGVGPLVPALRLLHERGHSIQLAARRVKSGHSHTELQALADECERVTYTKLPSGEGSKVAREVRLALDYRRYLEPRYRDAPKLRARAEKTAPPRLGRLPAWAVRALERSLPAPDHVMRHLAEQRPDLVLVTPLIDLGSRQADWLRAAKRLGIRTGFPVLSWDNLTNKGLVRDEPDLVLVWNDLQAREAEELHGISRERIQITGAPVCDPWFDRQPSRTREELCHEVNLDPEQPIVLYVCSSQFVAPNEVEFVPRWLDRLRSRGGLLEEAGYLIRPYPDTARRWLDAGIEGPQVSVWPRFGEGPHDEATRANYFDSIYHAAAVVGINTTAQIEAAITGTPVHTVLADEFRDTQEGTLHFRYLEADDYGLLHVGRTWDEHAAQLEASLRGEGDDGRNERFLRRFVRPLGLDRPATPLVADAIEELGARPAPAPARPPFYAAAGRALAVRLARADAPSPPPRTERRGTSPARELRRAVDRLARGTGPIVAGPWTGDEVGELLYWVPFLRWAQTANIGLRERLYVLRRPEHAAWYAGIGAGTDGPVDAERLSAELVLAARPELARQDPGRRIQHRLLEFAPIPGGAPYEGPYGAEAFLAVLAGHPAKVTGAERADPDDLLVAETWLARPPFGSLQTDRPRRPWERLSELEEYEAITEMRLEHVVPVREPLVLISQIQRSGGTLLSQLFDGHPQLHSHPHEICIGKPAKWDWPPLDLSRPESWFETLHEPLLAEWVKTGYVKDLTDLRKEDGPDVFPFVFSLKLQRAIFERFAEGAERERDVLDAYFTSYFNAWLDNHNLYTGAASVAGKAGDARPENRGASGAPGSKQAVVGFTPRLAMELERVERLFAAYPDGLLVSVVRDPRGWYASARGHRGYYEDLEQSIGLWSASTEAAIEAAARFGERVALLTYEELLEDPEAAMKALAARIGVAPTPELLVPSFNGRPIRANSSEAVDRTGILRERGSAFRRLLSADEIGAIERQAGDLYERAAAISRSERASVSLAK
jgi:Sulfotransferase family